MDPYPEYNDEIGAAAGMLAILALLFFGWLFNKSPDSTHDVEDIDEDDCETSVNSDFFAACVYEETDDPAAFMLNDK